MKRKHFAFLILPLIITAAVWFFVIDHTSEASELLYIAQKGDFTITVESEGLLEAKNSIDISTPQIRWTVPTINWLIPEGSRVKKGDLVVDLEAGEIERRYLNAVDELAIAKADAEKGKAELKMERESLQSQLLETEASLQASKLQLSKLEFEPWRTQEITRLKIASDSLDADRIRQKLVTLKQIQTEERAKLQLKIQQAERKVTVSKHNLNQLQLTSPADGIVEYAVNRRTGEKIKIGESPYPRMPLVKIPDLTIMQAKLKINETDAKKIQVGQTAEIRIPSIQKTVTGKVDKVDKMAKPIKRGSKIKKVEVAVTVDSSDVVMASGLTVRCKIFTKTIPNVTPLPYECVFDKDSMKVIYTSNGSNYSAKAISVVAHGDDFLAVLADIEDGQACALREPNTSNVHWPDTLTAPVIETRADTNKALPEHETKPAFSKQFPR